MAQPNMWNLELYNWYCSSDTLKGYFASQNLVDAALLSNYLLKYDWIITKMKVYFVVPKEQSTFGII